jgi:uncharacterized protein
MPTRENIAFKSDDITLRGWFYTPDHSHPAPCVIMTHGFSALKEHYLDKFAVRFADAGISILAYDNRNFGESEGVPRLEVDPEAQIQDIKNAITFVQGIGKVDPKRIGLWGTSFSGGVMLAVAGTDKRATCVVAQVPFIRGHHKFLRENKPEQWEKIKNKYAADRAARKAGNPPAMIQVVADGSEKPAIMKIPSAYSFFTSVESWKNEVTFRSVENAGEFEPIAYIQQISPAPILFIVAKNDTVDATDLALMAYSEALEPKKLVLIEGDHFAPYDEQFDISVSAACGWYRTHLLEKMSLTDNEVAALFFHS